MKKILVTSILSLFLVASLPSCVAIHSGYMANSASLSSANFIYIRKYIEGQATASYVFGIGGLDRETLVSDAKEKMLKICPLGDNEALVNLTVNFKSSYYLGYVFIQVTCTVTADVVEFHK